MATRRKITTEETEEPEDTSAKTPELDEDVVRALVEIDSANEIRWQIIRVSNPNSGYCFELSTAELSLDRIAKDAGPGKYRVRGIKQDGTYYKSATLTVSQPIRPPAGATPPPGADGSTMQLLTLMMQSSQAAAAEQTKVLTALISKPASQIPWPALIAAAPLLIKEARDIFRQPDKDDASMERVLKLVTIVEKLKGKDDGNGNTNWADVVREGLSQVSAVAAARFGVDPNSPRSTPVQGTVIRHDANARTALSHTADAIPTSDDVRRAADTEAVEPTIQMLGEQWLRTQLDTLLVAAANNKNPELRGELFCDELPAYLPEAMVVAMLSADDWFATLQNFDARVASYPAWFTELRDTILETLEPKGDPADDTHAD